MGDKGKKNADKLNKEKTAKKTEVQLKKGQATQRTGSAPEKK